MPRRKINDRPIKIMETYNTIKFTYMIMQKKLEDTMDFLSRDIFGILEITNPKVNHYLLIIDIDVDKKAKSGHVNLAFNEFANMHPEEIIAFRLSDDDDTLYHNDLFCELNIDLEESGFRNINSYCGFEESVPYIFRNEASKELLRAIIRMEIRYNNGNEMSFKDLISNMNISYKEYKRWKNKKTSNTKIYNN